MRRKLKTLAAVCAMIAGGSACCTAQEFAVKTNLLYDAVTTMNIAGEVKLAPKWTAEVSGSLNPWTFSDNKRWKNWCAMPEARYWLCDAWDGHFLGLHAFGGQYNIGGISGLPDFLGTDLSRLADHRYEGWYAGAGVSYGYDWILGTHWNIEAEIGLGWSFTRYNEYKCASCQIKTDSHVPHNYFGPTKAAVNVTYIF